MTHVVSKGCVIDIDDVGNGLERTLDDSRAMSGQGNDRHGALAEDLARCLDTVETRQVQVDQDQVGPMLPGELDRLDAVSGIGDDVESCVFENQPQIGRTIGSSSTVRTLAVACDVTMWLPPVFGNKKDPRRLA